MPRITISSISRRTAVLGGLVLPWSIGSGAAQTPMGESDLRALLTIYKVGRDSVAALQNDRTTIAYMLHVRDGEAGKIVKASGGAFKDWPATAREARPHASGRWLGYRVELDRDTFLQTGMGDDERTATMIAMADPLADAARASLSRSVRVSGVFQLKDGAPIDLLAASAKPGQAVSLLVTFTRIELAG